LDGIEFARGPADSEWGKLRAEMGHPEPFDLKYMAIGNEDCGKQHYEGEGLDDSLLQLFSRFSGFSMWPWQDKAGAKMGHFKDIYEERRNWTG
jgi:alpha-L-arabinofuranosidase